MNEPGTETASTVAAVERFNIASNMYDAVAVTPSMILDWILEYTFPSLVARATRVTMRAQRLVKSFRKPQRVFLSSDFCAFRCILPL